MLKKLRRRFVFLYTVSAGAIFLVMLVMLYMWNGYQHKQELKERFMLQMDQTTYELQKSIMFNATSFQQLESRHHLMLCFEEKGQRLSYINNYGTEEERERLFSIVRKKAEAENVFPNISPNVLENMKSSVFSISGKDRKQYLGQAVILPNVHGWKSIIMIQDVTGNITNQENKWGIYGGGAVLALLLLFGFSYWFVRKTMKPVEEAQIKQNEFVAAASHELKSPLAVIKTCASALTTEDEQQQEFIEGIKDECGRMSKLIQDLLLLASAETKSWKMRMEEFALDEFLIQEYDHFSLLVSNKKMELTLALPDAMDLKVLADRNRLLQVMTILLDNAVSYAPEKSRIEIGLVSEKKHLLLSVADHGIGISNQEKKQIFERFHRGDKARNDKSHYGLGLSIGYELVQRMGGTIKVVDTPGGGATFVIDFTMNNQSRY